MGKIMTTVQKKTEWNAYRAYAQNGELVFPLFKANCMHHLVK